MRYCMWSSLVTAALRETLHWFLECRWKNDVNSAYREKKTDLLRDMKWIDGVAVMLLWWLNEVLFTARLHYALVSGIEIPDDAQINDELSQTFFLSNERNKCKFSNVCVIFITAVANYLPNRLLRH